MKGENTVLDESIVEDADLTWFGELGQAVRHSPAMVYLTKLPDGVEVRGVLCH